jgi:hypothetical protein
MDRGTLKRSGTNEVVSERIDLITTFGTRILADAFKQMTSFRGEHLALRQITDQRIATAWIGNRVITADQHGISISTTGTVKIRIHAKGIAKDKITAASWAAPGLQVSVKADHKSFTADVSGDYVDLVYIGITAMRREIASAAD